MTFKKLLSLILCSLLLITVFAGCSAQGGDYILYIEADQKPTTLDPQLANGTTEEMIVRNLFEGLMRYDKDGNLKNGVAESVETSADGLTYTFKIGDDAVWSDKTPLVADDFVFAAERALDPKTKSPKASFLYCIKNAKEINNGENLPLGITAVSEKVLKISLTAKNPDFLKLLTTSVFMPCNRKAFAKFKGKYGMNSEDFLSNGSFTVKSWTRDGDFNLRINKNLEYKGDFTAQTSAVIFSVGDKAYRMEKLNKNNIDMGFVNLSDAYESVSVSEFSKTCYSLIINPNSAFGTEEFKKAIRMSIDKTALKESLSDNLVYAENILPDVIFGGGESLNTKVEVAESIGYNAEQARANYLKGVGEHGDPGNITILYFGDESVKSVALFVAESLQKTLGVIANIENLSDIATLNSKIADGDYMLSIAPITAESNSLTQYLGKFSSENSSNIYKFSNKSFDSIYSSTADYLRVDELSTRTEQMLKIIDQRLILTPLFYEKEAFGYASIYSCPKISPFDGVIDFAEVRK